MNDLPSNWEWPWKLLAVVLFIIVMAGGYWFFHKLAYDWIPESLIGYVAIALVCSAAGYLLGQRSMALHVKKLWGKDPREGI
jgi:hypothetical protein